MLTILAIWLGASTVTTALYVIIAPRLEQMQHQQLRHDDAEALRAISPFRMIDTLHSEVNTRG